MKNFLLRLYRSLLKSTNVKRALRGALMAFLAVFVPGLLGFLHALTAWAPGQALPDLHPLASLFVAAVLAGTTFVVNLVIVAIETASGKGILRDVPPVLPTDTDVQVE